METYDSMRQPPADTPPRLYTGTRSFVGHSGTSWYPSRLSNQDFTILSTMPGSTLYPLPTPPSSEPWNKQKVITQPAKCHVLQSAFWRFFFVFVLPPIFATSGLISWSSNHGYAKAMLTLPWLQRTNQNPFFVFPNNIASRVFGKLRRVAVTIKAHTKTRQMALETRTHIYTTQVLASLKYPIGQQKLSLDRYQSLCPIPPTPTPPR